MTDQPNTKKPDVGAVIVTIVVDGVISGAKARSSV